MVSKEEIRQSLLDCLANRGIAPGRLLIAKNGATLPYVRITIEQLQEKIEEISTPLAMEMLNGPLAEGTILMFINAHGIRRKVDQFWDFWYEFLIEEQIFFVPSSRFGDWKIKNEFEVK